MNLFPDILYLSAWSSGVLFTLVLTPLWERWCHKHSWVDHPGPRKIHHHPIPLAGGLAVFSSIVLSLLAASIVLVCGLWPESAFLPLLQYGMQRRAVQLVGICLGGIGMLILGWYDDRHNLSPFQKLLGQMLISVIVAATGLRVTLFIPFVPVTFLLTALWFVAVTNAMNLMDNMDGLCTGLTAIIAFLISWYAALYGQFLTAGFGFLLCGAFAGFLPYNFPKARAFLGDAGSHLAGYCLAVLAILPDFYSPEHQTRWTVLTPLFFLAIPLLDMARVIVVRWHAGAPIFHGDNRHLSHLLVRIGFSRTIAVELIWLFQAIFGVVPFFAFPLNR